MVRFSNGIMETPHFYGDSKYTIGDTVKSLYNWKLDSRNSRDVRACHRTLFDVGGGGRDAVKLYNVAAMKTVRGGGPPANRGCGNLDLPTGSL